jgi:hypothetical protein
MKPPCINNLCPHNDNGCNHKRLQDVEKCKRLIAYKKGEYVVKRYLDTVEIETPFELVSITEEYEGEAIDGEHKYDMEIT